MKPDSKDLRVKVLAAADRGMPRKEVAGVFGVSEPPIRRYLRLHRETGDVRPRLVPGPPARKRGALEKWLPAQANCRCWGAAGTTSGCWRSAPRVYP